MNYLISRFFFDNLDLLTSTSSLHVQSSPSPSPPTSRPPSPPPTSLPLDYSSEGIHYDRNNFDSLLVSGGEDDISMDISKADESTADEWSITHYKKAYNLSITINFDSIETSGTREEPTTGLELLGHTSSGTPRRIDWSTAKPELALRSEVVLQFNRQLPLQHIISFPEILT